MKHGYALVSTEDQNPAMQLAALKNEGCPPVSKDEVTGAHVKTSTVAAKIIDVGRATLCTALQREAV
jgi:DNA invertase Pin-like site-specific DNA recombinase